MIRHIDHAGIVFVLIPLGNSMVCNHAIRIDDGIVERIADRLLTAFFKLIVLAESA